MRRVGRYLLVREISCGGMGAVFLGRLDVTTETRWVAIKRPHDQFLHEPEARDMFLREARIASLVRHPNVVETLDVITTEQDELYCVMEFIDGESLSNLQRLATQRGLPIPSSVVLRIVLDVLAGLDAVHGACDAKGIPLGIVHRDITPHNVLIGLDGRARIADFGIAKTATHHTATGSGLKGKVRYVAPEQIHGSDATPAADIYSACVVAWELLAGEPLFSGGSEAAILARVLGNRIRPLPRSGKAAEVDPEVEEAIMHGLHKDPEARPPSAGVLARRLARADAIATHDDVARFIGEVAGSAIRDGVTQTAASPTSEGTMTVAHLPELTVPMPAASDRASTSDRPNRPARSSGRTVVATFSALAVVLFAAFLVRRAEHPAAHAPPIQSVVANTPASTVAPVAPSAVSPSLPSSLPSPTDAASRSPLLASGSASSSEGTRAAARVGGPRGQTQAVNRHVAAKSASSAAASNACDVPYFVDGSGIRRIKKECY